MIHNPYLPESSKILLIKKETDLEYTFRLKTKLRCKPGQFFMLSLPKIGEAPFSPSGISNNWVEFTIRKVGLVSNALFQLKLGEIIYLRGPYGNGFLINDYANKNLVIVTGGTGIVPVKPIIDYYYNNSSAVKKINLLFGFKNPSCILFYKDIKKWRKKFQSILTVDEACDVSKGERIGLVTKYIKDIELSEINNTEIIIIGPPIMMKYSVSEFLKRVPKEKIIVSFERRMSCGVGKCGHCKINDSYVCTDGPVYRYSQAERLID